jgi:hypothetical protein
MSSRHRLRHNLSRVMSRIPRCGGGGLVAAWLLITASGCATVDSTAKLQAAKTVGIVSAIGDEFTVTEAGLAAPGDAEQHFSIEPWGLDDLIVARAGARLSPRYQVATVTYPRASFVAREQRSPFTLLNMKSGRDDRIAELVRGQVSPQGLDVYVVISKAEVAFGSRGRAVAGIGLIQHVAVFGSSTQLHALYRVTVIDGHTLQVIDKRTAAPGGGGEMFSLAGPSREVGADLVPAAQDPGGSNQLKAAVLDLIDRSLADTLQELHLGDRSAS